MKKNSKLLTSSDISVPDKRTTERVLEYLSIFLLFGLTAVYFYWFGSSLFFSQENKSLFIYSLEYCQKFAAQPGGLLLYAGNFVTQGYFSPLYGALVISSIITLLCLVFKKIINRLSPGNSFSLFLLLLPSSLLIIMQAQFDLSVNYSIGFLIVAICFYFSIVSFKNSVKIICFALFPVLFYLVGSFAWIYLGMYIMYSLLYEEGNDRYILPLILAAIAFVTFLVFKEVLFLEPADHMLGYPLLYSGYSRLTTYLSMFGGFFVLFPLLAETTNLFKINRKFGIIISLSAMLTVFTIIIFSLTKQYNSDLENLAQLEKSVYEQDWNAVIKQHERTPSKNAIGQYFYNLALSEKGQLCSRMFFGQQNFGPLSLILPRDNEQSFRAMYFYYALGITSEAHHLAYELMVQHGYRPEIIKMLIKTELINGNLKIAERYINVLKKTLHYKEWAEKYEKMLVNPELIKSDPELGDKIRSLPKKDFFILTDDEKNVDLLLKENPDNRRAFEYKIARLLLEKDFVEVVPEVKKMKEIGYTAIPRHIDEALERYINITKSAPDLGGLSISDDTKERYLQFGRAFIASKGNMALFEKNLINTDRNTFWYYLQFNYISHDLTMK